MQHWPICINRLAWISWRRMHCGTKCEDNLKCTVEERKTHDDHGNVDDIFEINKSFKWSMNAKNFNWILFWKYLSTVINKSFKLFFFLLWLLKVITSLKNLILNLEMFFFFLRMQQVALFLCICAAFLQNLLAIHFAHFKHFLDYSLRREAGREADRVIDKEQDQVIESIESVRNVVLLPPNFYQHHTTSILMRHVTWTPLRYKHVKNWFYTLLNVKYAIVILLLLVFLYLSLFLLTNMAKSLVHTIKIRNKKGINSNMRMENAQKTEHKSQDKARVCWKLNETEQIIIKIVFINDLRHLLSA